MRDLEARREFYKQYDLNVARKTSDTKTPAEHQAQALEKLFNWYKLDPCPCPNAGGILVLPTGAGKTFTAIRFLCHSPLSDGYKVLWLARTHHLLEQAFVAFEEGVSQIAESRSRLSVRVVSGVPGHFKARDISPSDDVLICTLQTISHAYREAHPQLNAFVEASKGKLFVVFDEAHHAPAPSYRDLIAKLRDRCKDFRLLGLTATPTYYDETKSGWLKKLFPQGILHSVAPALLMAQKILAKPILEEPQTEFSPDFDDREYQKWIDTYRDIPEKTITELAENKDRNLKIASHYVNDKEKYGKTIMFADRWTQCEQISEFLRARGVRADSVYSHVDADPGSVEARNKRTADENAKVLHKFRNNELDVVINVRMLTEGTDIPDVKSVFLTRQTTSEILITQMVGRALRGSKFGGKKDEAYIVSFIDNWRQSINWAGYDQLAEGLADASIPEYGKRPPALLISIELVQRLARQMDSGVNISPAPYLSLLPVGWYAVAYQVLAEGSDETPIVRALIPVYSNEETNYKGFVAAILTQTLDEFQAEDVRLDGRIADIVGEWRRHHFPVVEEHFGSSLDRDLLVIARHVAQNGAAPKFFPFEERNSNDLDVVADNLIHERLNAIELDANLRVEYNRTDRMWRLFYPIYERFKSHYDACINRLLHAKQHGSDPLDHRPAVATFTAQAATGVELSEEIKGQVKARDNYRCLCCGCETKRSLEVDHIRPVYLSVGGTDLADYQTLCRTCNQEKGYKLTINFCDNKTDLTESPATFPDLKLSNKLEDVRDADHWKMFIQRSINFFYRCGAVCNVQIGQRREAFYNWTVKLHAGNEPAWMQAHLQRLLERVKTRKEEFDFAFPYSIEVGAPDKLSAYYNSRFFDDMFKYPKADRLDDIESWRQAIKRGVDKYYSWRKPPQAVSAVVIDDGGQPRSDWRIELKTGHQPAWIGPHMKRLLAEIRAKRLSAGLSAPRSFTVYAADKLEVTVVHSEENRQQQ